MLVIMSCALPSSDVRPLVPDQLAPIFMLMRRTAFVVLGGLGLLLILITSTVKAQKPTLVSIQAADVSSGGTLSEDPVTSANGRFVAFTSSAFNVSPLPDTNGGSDVFVRDLQAGTTILVSVNLAGTATGNGSSRKPVISADGRFVAFESTANNLVSNDTNTWTDVFVRDLQTGTTAMVSVNNAGVGNGTQESLAPVISANGRVVIFKSFASNLIANDNNNTIDVFARDLQTGITSLVSCNITCTASGNDASFPAGVPKDKAPRALISKDGRFVVFESNATDLVTLSDSNGHGTDVFVRDLQSNTTSLVSINRFGTGSGNGGGTQPVISGNGRMVFFQSSSSDLTANGAPFSFNLYARDLQAGVTTMVSVTTSNTPSVGPGNLNYFPVASDDGRYVIFQSNAKNYVSNDSNNGYDVFLRDLQTNTTTLISVNIAGGTSPNGDAFGSVMSADGRYVAFIGFGPDYVSTPDTNARSDVYLRDVAAGTTTLLTPNSAGTNTANLGGDYPVISADGRFVVFESAATDMVPNPIIGFNVFAVAINGRVKFDAGNVNVDETSGTASVSVTRTGSTSGALTVQYATSNGTAAAAADYSAVSGSITFGDGETSKTIVVPILNDTIDEPDERLALTLSDFNASSGTAGSLDMTLLTLTDDDPPPSVSINDVEVNEGNSGMSVANFTLNLSNVSGKPISLSVSAAPGTASVGTDYNFFQTTVTISPGNPSQNISVPILGDTRFEDDETFFINLSNPTNVTIADGQGMGTIKNDDPIPSLTINDVTLAEGSSGTRLFVFTVRLSNPSSRQITVQFATADETAEAGSDYVMAAGTLTVSPGLTSTVALITVNGDTLVEGNETFFVNLSNPTDASLGDSQGVGTIIDDDVPVLVTEENSESAVALDSVTLMRDPFPLIRPYSFGPDLHTRVLLFAVNLDLLPGEDASAVTASADDEFGNTYSLPVEYVGLVPAVSGLSEVIVRLPDNVGTAQQLRIKISLRGATSNDALIRIAAP